MAALNICPICKCRMNVEPAGHRFEGDKSPDTETIAYFLQNEICNNTKCGNYKQVVNTIEHKLN